MRKRRNLLIGEQTAEAIKVAVGSAMKLDKPKEMTVKGRDVAGGMPKSIIVDSNDVAEALKLAKEVYKYHFTKNPVSLHAHKILIGKYGKKYLFLRKKSEIPKVIEIIKKSL